jgi:hypothetical protein
MDALEHELGGLLLPGLPAGVLGQEGRVVELLVFALARDTNGRDGAALLIVVVAG